MKRVLDLFCGGGGAAKGLQRAGFHVTGIDINRQSNYCGDVFICCDALALTLVGYEFIWASPPCQAYTRKSENWGRKRTYFYDHKELIEPVRDMLVASGIPFVIENIMSAPIRQDLMLCGSMFGLRIRKHRKFESNLKLNPPEACCNHTNLYNPWQGTGRSAAKLRDAMGIDWLPISGGASRKAGYTGDLFNAVPPAYTEFIGRQVMEQL